MSKDVIVQVDSLPFTKQETIVDEKNDFSRSRSGTFQSNYETEAVSSGRPTSALLSFATRVLRYCFYILPVGIIIAIPTVLFATRYRSANIDGVSLVGLFVYIEAVWISLWVSKLVAFALPWAFACTIGNITTSLRRYGALLHAVEIPMSIFIWAIQGLCCIPLIYAFDKDEYARRQQPWVDIVRCIMKASLGSSALLLIEKLLIQMISVNYHERQYRDRIQDVEKTTLAIERLYAASRKLYPIGDKRFIDEDDALRGTYTDNTNTPHQKKPNQSFRNVIRGLHDCGETFINAIGKMAGEVVGTTLLHTTGAHARVATALENENVAEALARRIHKSFVRPGSTGLYKSDIRAGARSLSDNELDEIFDQLDKDKNGDVSLAEMIMLIKHLVQQTASIAQSAHNIRDALKALDRVISVILFVIVILIYSMFFSTFVADNYKNIITLLSASAFSFGQTVGEFNAACILVFVKHPFDVADRVNFGEIEYEVLEISLLYTIFRRVDSGTQVQVANNVIGNLWIDNVTRSRAMRERLQFSVNSKTTFTDIEALRKQLQDFAKDPDNSRDYQDQVDIELHSLGDMKQLDLRVEIRHKSNWHNDQLRHYRRSKFLCALLSAMKKVGIESPAGSSSSQGSINNPHYNVSISEDAAKTAKTEYDDKKAAEQSVQVIDKSSIEKIISSGLEILPNLSKETLRYRR